MLKPIKHLLLANISWVAVVITISIAYLSLIHTSKLPVVSISNIDKVFHAIAYFALTSSWLWSLRKKVHKYGVVVACVFFGILIEVLQSKLTTYRTGEFLDFLANTTGAVIALLLFNQVFKKKPFN